MADVDSSGPGLDQTSKAGVDNTNVNDTDSGGTFTGEGSSKYGDSFGGGGTQNPEGTEEVDRSSGRTGTGTATPD